MKLDLNPQIRAKLITRFDMREVAVGGTEYLQQGRCPECNKKSLWTWANDPGNVQCNRKSKCAYSETTKSLFPELFENLSKNYAPTRENPNATADAYISLFRGFDPDSLKSFYKQSTYKNPNANRQTDTVRFWIDEANGVGWEKFIDKVMVTDPEDGSAEERDSRFIGVFKGKCWTPPTQPEPKIGQKVFITEGIFDAIALMLTGKFVISPLTAGNYPSEYIEKHRNKGVIWVFALDNDKAGRTDSLKHIARTIKLGETAVACMPAEDDASKVDWNDLHRMKKLSKQDFDEYEYFGGLLTAAKPIDKAKLIYKRSERSIFTFEFRQKLYGFNLKIESYEKEFMALKEAAEGDENSSSILSETQMNEIRDKALENSGSLLQIANCIPQFLYTQMNPITEELFYMFRVQFPDGRSVKSTMSGAQLSAPADFRKRLLSMASGSLFKGSKEHHEILLDKWMNNISEVETIAFAGYVAKHDTYVFQNFAVKDGRVVRKNNEDYCELPKLNIKSAYHNVDISVNHDLTQYKDSWFDNLAAAWGDKAITALAFWVGSLFVNQIRAKDKTFPFLELVGEPGTGKSTLIEFLWKLVGRFDYEGLDPSSSNPAAIARTMNQISGLPVVFMEGDRESRSKAKMGGFNWAETKKLYNGRSMKSRGMRTQGNETYEPPFMGSLVITQNSPVDGDTPVLERICHLFMKKSDCSPQTLVAARALGNVSMEDVSGFLLHCLKNKDKILETYFERQPVYEHAISQKESSKTPRIALNHSQMMALVEALKHVTPISKDQRADTQKQLMNMVVEREAAIKKEHPDVEWFFECVSTMIDKNVFIDHKKNDENHVALKLTEVYLHAAHMQLRLPEVNDMKKLLRGSRRFVDYKSVNSGITSKTAKCWIFEFQKDN